MRGLVTILCTTSGITWTWPASPPSGRREAVGNATCLPRVHTDGPNPPGADPHRSVGVTPLAFAIVGLYVAVWLIVDRRSFDWQSFVTVATWEMTLFIQRAEHRDTQAIHAKLDELLRTQRRARPELTVMDQKEPEEIERHRMHERG